MPETTGHYEEITPAEKSVSEIKHEVFERLGDKVEAVLAIRQTIEKLEPDSGPVTVHAALDQSWAAVKEIFSPETVAAFDRLEELETQLRENYAAERAILDSDQPVEAIGQLHQARKSLRRASTELMRNQDVQFLMNIDGLIDSLRYKNNIVEGLRGDRKKIAEAINPLLKLGMINAEEILRIEQTPFEITPVISMATYDRALGKTSCGKHLHDSPFSIVYDHSNVAGTIRHESVHNVSEDLAGIGEFDTKVFAELAKGLDDTQRDDVRAATEAQLGDYQPNSLLNQMHDEILADLDDWEQQRWNQDRPGSGLFDPAKPRSFDFHARRYSTAGVDAKKIVSIYVKAAAGSRDLARKQKLETIGEEFKTNFAAAIEHMRSGLRFARQHGDEAIEQLHALMFILPPSKYRHIERYLINKYGKKDRTDTQKMGKSDDQN